jgi:hypothetical protein
MVEFFEVSVSLALEILLGNVVTFNRLGALLLTLMTDELAFNVTLDEGVLEILIELPLS